MSIVRGLVRDNVESSDNRSIDRFQYRRIHLFHCHSNTACATHPIALSIGTFGKVVYKRYSRPRVLLRFICCTTGSCHESIVHRLFLEEYYVGNVMNGFVVNALISLVFDPAVQKYVTDVFGNRERFSHSSNASDTK